MYKRQAVPQEPAKADPLDAIMADDMPAPEQVTAEVVEKPKTVVLESVQPAQTPTEPPQNVIVLEQEPPAAAYTQSSPVEEIRSQMTYEQAQNVIVDCGTLSLIHISEPTRLGMISYAVFCLKKKKKNSIYIRREST